MALDNSQVIDAVSTEKDGSAVSLSIIDGWDWSQEGPHLIALQNKLNAYFDFVQSGQIYESYPSAKGKPIRIQIITKHPLSAKAEKFLTIAAGAASQLNLEISHRLLPT